MMPKAQTIFEAAEADKDGKTIVWVFRAVQKPF
jgi:hypothetical protein